MNDVLDSGAQATSAPVTLMEPIVPKNTVSQNFMKKLKAQYIKKLKILKKRKFKKMRNFNRPIVKPFKPPVLLNIHEISRDGMMTIKFN